MEAGRLHNSEKEEPNKEPGRVGLIFGVKSCASQLLQVV